MEGPPLGPGGEDITWPDQVAPRGQKASSTRKIKPQTSNRPTPPPPGPLTPGTPTPTAPPGAKPPRLRQRPARRTYRPQRMAGRCLSGTTPHQPDRRHGRQNCHLPAARPPAQAPARIRHALLPRRTPRSPRTQGAYPSRQPWRDVTPGGHRHRRTMAPNRLHRRPNRSVTRPRRARKDCRDPRNEHRHQQQWGNLAGERTSHQCGVPT